MTRVTLTLPTAALEQRLARLLATVEREADQVVLDTAVAVLAEVVEHWPVDTGVSRAAWWGPRQVQPAHYEIGNPVQWATTIEYGGWKSPGPKTVRAGGETLPGDIHINQGVYSSQVASAPVRRALSNHHNDITEGLQQLLRTAWRS